MLARLCQLRIVLTCMSPEEDQEPALRPDPQLPELTVENIADCVSQASEAPVSLVVEIDSSEIPPGVAFEEMETQEIGIVLAARMLLGVGTMFEAGQDETGSLLMGELHTSEACARGRKYADVLSGNYPDSIDTADMAGKLTENE